MVKRGMTMLGALGAMLAFTTSAHATVVGTGTDDHGDYLTIRGTPGETNQLTARSLDGPPRATVALTQTGALLRLTTAVGIPLLAPSTPCTGGLVLLVCTGMQHMPIHGTLGDGNDSVDTTGLQPAARVRSWTGDLVDRDDHWHLGPGNDVFRGGPSNEHVLPQGGADDIDLGAGDDVAVLYLATTPVAVRCGPGHDEVRYVGTVDHAISDDCEVVLPW